LQKLGEDYGDKEIAEEERAKVDQKLQEVLKELGF